MGLGLMALAVWQIKSGRTSFFRIRIVYRKTDPIKFWFTIIIWSAFASFFSLFGAWFLANGGAGGSHIKI